MQAIDARRLRSTTTVDRRLDAGQDRTPPSASSVAGIDPGGIDDQAMSRFGAHALRRTPRSRATSSAIPGPPDLSARRTHVPVRSVEVV
jgi:hypothetical protein